MLTKMSEADWEVALAVFRAALPRRGDKGRDDRKFLEALHFFTFHNITRRRCRPSSATGTRSGRRCHGTGALGYDCTMQPVSSARHQFPPEIIRHAVWLYLRFTLGYRDVEELLAERVLDVSYETVPRPPPDEVGGPRYSSSMGARRYA